MSKGRHLYTPIPWAWRKRAWVNRWRYFTKPALAAFLKGGRK